ncbi:MAG: FHA domain-containing protein [Oscillospiraceae bacterium]|nr:FHA domain-containing protein [Oscillospiraceae bacterium]
MAMNTSAMCPHCMREDAVRNGVCRFCRKKADVNIPIGVLPPGIILAGRYLTGLYIGKGGFGITYRALDLNRGELVAVKEYCPDSCSRRETGSKLLIAVREDEYAYGKKHFIGEAEILENLRTIPGVVQFRDSFEENNTAYYVMEYLEGESLSQYVKSRQKPLGFTEAVELLLPAIRTLEEVHKKNTFHRDINPNNIFVCRDGTMRVIDFGAGVWDDSVFAKTFMPVETEGYSPPEQHRRGDNQGAWCDSYAMCATVYRCVYGRRPTAASARLAGDSLPFDGSTLSEKQVAVLRKGMSLRTAERYQSMEELEEALLDSLDPREADRLRQRAGKKPDHDGDGSGHHSSQVIERDRFPISDDNHSVPGPAGNSSSTGRQKNSLANWLQELLWKLFPSLRNPNSGSEKVKSSLTRLDDPNSSQGLANERGTSLPELFLEITGGLYKGGVLPLVPGVFMIGRSSDRCNLVYPNEYSEISREHLLLTVDAAHNIFITDKSTNGTWLNGQRLERGKEIQAKPGCVIAFGKETIIIRTKGE